jgi:hypothetical protein
MSLLREIKNQSEGVRKAMFALSVITLVSLVGTLWFRSFQTNLYALMNKDEAGAAGDQRQLAGPDDGSGKVQSPFAAIGSMFKDLGAQMSGLFNDAGSSPNLPKDDSPIRSGKAQSLPISR